MLLRGNVKWDCLRYGIMGIGTGVSAIFLSIGYLPLPVDIFFFALPFLIGWLLFPHVSKFEIVPACDMSSAVSLKKKFVAVLLLLVMYCGSYTVLSLLGEYQITMSGERRYTTGLALFDIYKWTPKYVVFEIYTNVRGKRKIRGCNSLGAFYSPLVYLDRTFFHKTKNLFENDLDE